MKCIVSNDVLLKNLQAINGVIATNSSLPILETFLFEMKEEHLLVTASDMETSIQVEIPVNMVENPGKIAIPAKILVETLKTLPAIPVTISAEDPSNPLNIEIIAGEGKYKLAGYDPSDYPRRPDMDEADTIEINSDIIATAIAKTIFATISDMLRPAMTGVFCEMTDTHVNFVGTDAHRLVRYKRKDIKSETPFSFILPKKTSNILKNILMTVDAPVKVEYNNINASFSFENYNLICRLIDQKYPNYEAVIPTNNPNKLIVNRTELVNSLKRATIYANQSTHQVRFIIAGQSLTLQAEDIDFANEAVETLTCNYDGSDMEIGFNAKFIIEMLQNMDDETVMFELSEAKRAGLILPSEPGNPEEDILMLVMPVMIAG
jgi:DNA polymerase III subunit beta